MRTKTNTKNSRAAVILKKFWQRKKASDPKQFSLRNIAKAVKMSPGQLSKIFSSKKNLRIETARALIALLKVDSFAAQAVYDQFRIEEDQTSRHLKITDVVDGFQLTNEDAEWLLDKWHRVAILDLMTTADFKSEVGWIANRLGLTDTEVQNSLKVLLQSNLAIKTEDGIYKKKYNYLRFPTTTSKVSFRQHHKIQLQRAINVLDKKTLPKDYNKRLIMGFSVACNPDRLAAAKEILHNALYEASVLLSEGDCYDVYQLNLQLFPQTK